VTTTTEPPTSATEPEDGDESDSGTDSVTTTTVPYVDDVSPCPEGREVENSEECLD
jgi:hypothetical protein